MRHIDTFRDIYTDDNEDLVYLPFYGGVNADEIAVTLRLRCGNSITLISEDGSLHLALEDTPSMSYYACGQWLEAARHYHLNRLRYEQGFDLDEEGRRFLLPQGDHWMLVVEDQTVRLELAEVEQLLNFTQLIIGTSIKATRPSDMLVRNGVDAKILNMEQACQNAACCAHGHHFVQPQTLTPSQ